VLVGAIRPPIVELTPWNAMIPRLSTSRDAAIVTTSHIEVTSRRCSSEAKGECFVSVLVLIFLLQAATHLFNWIQSLPHCGMTMTVCGGNASCRRLCLAKIPSACVFIAFQLARVGRSRRLLTVKISRRLFNFSARWSFGEAQVRLE
jgi:hypothetical protein